MLAARATRSKGRSHGGVALRVRKL
jgi:hypothetical protein